MQLVLIGPYCAGKTTLGKALASHLEWDFYDSDEVLGNARELHQSLGVEEFRRQECEALRTLLSKPRSILATGGGVVTSPDSLTLLKTVRPIYLAVEREELWRRWQTRGTPYFCHSRGDFESYLNERIPLYELVADRVVSANNMESALWEVIDLANTFRSPHGESLTAPPSES